MPVQTKENILCLQIEEDFFVHVQIQNILLCLYKGRYFVPAQIQEDICVPVQTKEDFFVSTNPRRYFCVCINPGTYFYFVPV